MDIQVLVDKARKLKSEGKLQRALACYNDALSLLIKEADKHARNTDGAMIDVGKVRTITSKLFDEAKNYLKRDKITAVVSNNMGTILAELGDYEGAKKIFEQAIELTPDGEDYPDPKIGLEELKK